MKTYDNGVAEFESEEEFLNKPNMRKRICVYPVYPLGSFSVSRIRDDKSRVTVRCHSEQDALDIAGFFANRTLTFADGHQEVKHNLLPDCIGKVADYKVKVDPNAEPNTVRMEP